MYILQKNNFFITTLLTFAILTTMTITIHKEVFGISYGGVTIDKGGVSVDEDNLPTPPLSLPPQPPVSLPPITQSPNEVFEDAKDFGSKTWENLKSEAGETAGDWAEDNTGYRSSGDAIDDASETAGDWAEDKIGYRSTGEVQSDWEDDGKLQKLEQSEAGETAGDWAELNYGCRSTEGCVDKYSKFDVTIPFTLPTPKPIAATVQLTGDLTNIKDTKYKLTIAGLQPISMNIHDYTIEQKFEATLESLLRDLFPELAPALLQDIDKGKELINNVFGIQINDVAKFKLDVSVKVPIPQSVSDITEIENLVPIPSLVLQGCYNKISNNLPDYEKVNDLESLLETGNETKQILDDHNKAVNQEYECTQLLPA